MGEGEMHLLRISTHPAFLRIAPSACHSSRTEYLRTLNGHMRSYVLNATKCAGGGGDPECAGFCLERRWYWPWSSLLRPPPQRRSPSRSSEPVLYQPG